jgi:hypothetical protein
LPKRYRVFWRTRRCSPPAGHFHFRQSLIGDPRSNQAAPSRPRRADPPSPIKSHGGAQRKSPDSTLTQRVTII